MLKPREGLLLGVSGGPDSLAMLYLFDSLRKSWGLKIYVAHLNHRLRKEAAVDSAFVENTCQKLMVPFISEEIDLKGGLVRGSLEERARELRLDFLIRTARKIQAKVIGLGHTKDDQAETVLMHLLRGSGLLGLSGIVPKRNIQGLIFIRPLIEIERKDIEAYLKSKRVRARRDVSNKELIYFRNRIRHKLLPHLAKGYNRNIKELLANTAQIISADYDYMQRQGRKYLKLITVSAPLKLGFKIKLNKFKKLHPAMQRLVLRLSIEKIRGHTRRLSFQHWKELEDLITSRKNGSIVNLPGSIVAKKTDNYLLLSLRK